MSDNKRKRSGDHYGSPYKPSNHPQGPNQPHTLSTNPILQQPIIINPVLAHTEQYNDVDPIQLLNNQNPQSNLVYLLLPPGTNQSQSLLQGVQTLLLMPKEEQASLSDGPPQLHYYVPVEDKPQLESGQKGDDIVYIKDVKVVKSEDEYLQGETDPLQIQVSNMQDFALMPQYEEAPQQAGNVLVLNDSDFQKVQQGETMVDSARFKMQFKCDHLGCLLTFPSVYEKKIHADTHTFPASTEFKCTICNMSFDRAVDRNRHVDSHAVVNTYKCKTCEASFPYYTTLVRHVNEQKCASSKSYSCHYCGVQFLDVDDLDKHQKDNLKFCACRAKICSEPAYDLHTSLCSVYKQKLIRAKSLQHNKNLPSTDVIVLD